MRQLLTKKVNTLLLPFIILSNTILSSTALSNTLYADDGIQEQAFDQKVDKAIALSLAHLESSAALIKDPTLFPTYANKALA